MPGPNSYQEHPSAFQTNGVIYGERHIERAQRGQDDWNAWAKAEIDAGQTHYIDFSNAEIDFDFIGFVFPGDVSFKNATFAYPALFEDAVFKGYAVFDDLTFRFDASFNRARFEDFVSFSGVTFGRATFGQTKFKHAAFVKTKFREADFFGATFEGTARFDEAVFDASAGFDARFGGNALFNGIVANRPPNFRGATFAVPPDLHGNKIGYQVIKKGFWRRMLKCADDELAAPRYRRLKQLAGDAKDHDSELRFFALELQAKRFHETDKLASIALNVAYGWLSDYGRSIGRPLKWLSGIFMLSTACILYARWTVVDCTSVQYLLSKLGAAGVLAFTNMMLVVGADKWGTWREDTFKTLCAAAPDCHTGFNWFENLFAYGQSALSLLLFFLMGLGLRNRFRIGSGGGA